MPVELRGSKCLVAGGTGFLGKNIAKRLLAEGAEVRVTGNRRTLDLKHDRLEFMRADLTRMEDCQRAVAGMDHVFLCAASTQGAAVMTRTPLAQVTPNVLINTQMLDAAYQARVKKFLFVSSSAAYPPTDARPVRESEMFEGDPYDVYYAVGWMKRYAEVLCRVYSEKIKEPMSTVVVRPSNVYGPHDKFDFATSHMFAALLRRVVERQDPFEVWGTGNDIRDVIYVDDFVEGTIRAFRDDARHLAVNIAAGQGHSVREILATMMRVDGHTTADVRFDVTKPQTIPVRLVDTSFAEERLGFRAQVSLEEGIRRTLAWYRQDPAGAIAGTRS